MLAHGRTTLVGIGLRKRDRLVYNVDMGEIATTVGMLIEMKLAVEFVCANASLDTKERCRHLRMNEDVLVVVGVAVKANQVVAVTAAADA